MSNTIWDDPAATTAVGIVLLATFFMLLYMVYTLCCRRERYIGNIPLPSRTKSILKKNSDLVFTTKSNPQIQSIPFTTQTSVVMYPVEQQGPILYMEPHSSHPPVPPQITHHHPYAPQGALVLEPPIIQVNTRA